MPRFDRYEMPHEQVKNATSTDTLQNSATASTIRLAPSIASQLPPVHGTQQQAQKPHPPQAQPKPQEPRNTQQIAQEDKAETKPANNAARYQERTTQLGATNSGLGVYAKAASNMLRYAFGGNESGKVEPYAIVFLVGAAGGGLILSGILTSAFLQLPIVGFLITGMFTAAQLAFWYQDNAPPIVRVMLLAMMLVSISFNVAGLHGLAQHKFDMASWQTWVYILLAAFIDIMPEPFFVLAIHGTFKPGAGALQGKINNWKRGK